jgi:hypothetical protein
VPGAVDAVGGEVIDPQFDDAEPSTPIPFPHAVTGAAIGAPTAPPDVVGWARVGTLHPPAELPPNPTLFPHAVTGAVTGIVAVEPDAPDEPAGLVPFWVAGAQLALAFPTVLPQAVTGAFVGAVALGPLPLTVVPLLLAPFGVAGAQLALAFPTALPQAVTGAVTGASTPGRPTPLEDPAPLEEAPFDAAPLEFAVGELLALVGALKMETAFPRTATGAVTGALTGAPGDGASGAVTAVELGAGSDFVPSMSTLFGPTLTGAVTGALIGALTGADAGALTGVAAPATSDVDVPSAEAMPDPRIHIPPTNMPACRQRLVQVFMTDLLFRMVRAHCAHEDLLTWPPHRWRRRSA